MYRKEVNERSPLRILERSIHGGLGAGNLGVVMSRAGAGSTAFLVQVGLDDIMQDKDVLHIALNHSVDHVLSWYEALFNDLAEKYELEEREEVRTQLSRHRIIQAFPKHEMIASQLEQVVALYQRNISFKPKAILIDGWNWEGDLIGHAAEIGAFASIARQLGAELWMSAQTHRSTASHPVRVPPPCRDLASLIDVAVFLEPEKDHLKVQLLKDHDELHPPDTHLLLNCNNLRLMTEEEHNEPIRLPAHGYTLMSGGANGAESLFGECAEQFGLNEQTFSFPGRQVSRQRGLIELSNAELHEGEVSNIYLQNHLHRSFPNTPAFRKVIQTIWHQVTTAGEVFVIGKVEDDQTVKGGTGWAAELGRHLHKPVYVFDQDKNKWFAALPGKDGWDSIENPRITKARFTGTGTRKLTAEGEQAIRTLFARSFDAKPKPQA